MHIHIVACRVMTRDLSLLVARSENTVDVTWLPQGLHETPSVLHAGIAGALEDLYGQLERKQLKRRPDCIVLGYGLCSKSIEGIVARDIPIIVPRTDDCIALFLGSERRYLDYFKAYPGTYWLNTSWIENSPEVDADRREQLWAELMEQYDDEDTVEYLLNLGEELVKNYKMVGYITSPTHEVPGNRDRARDYALEHGFEFKEFEGTSEYFERMVAGDFDDEYFLTVPPGYKIAYSDDPLERVRAVKAD